MAEKLMPALIEAYAQRNGYAVAREEVDATRFVLLLTRNDTGKLAARFREEGKSVMLAAADTFRAAAIDQLKLWGERADVQPTTAKGGRAGEAASD